jgi:alpha-L-rhamnosidase
LASGKKYFWKVQTWDGSNKATGYSEITHWEMGLLNSSDWKADWIAAPVSIAAS